MANTASFSFDPVTINAKAGEVFPVDILIYTGSEKVVSTDVFVNYDSEKLSALPNKKPRIESGELFQKTDAKLVSPGKLYLYGLNENITNANSTNGKIATIYFQAKKSGKTELNFDCISFQEHSSKIIKNDENFSNIVNCQVSRSHNTIIDIDAGKDVLGASIGPSAAFNPYFVAALLLCALMGAIFLRYNRLTKKLKNDS